MFMINTTAQSGFDNDPRVRFPVDVEGGVDFYLVSRYTNGGSDGLETSTKYYQYFRLPLVFRTKSTELKYYLVALKSGWRFVQWHGMDNSTDGSTDKFTNPTAYLPPFGQFVHEVYAEVELIPAEPCPDPIKCPEFDCDDCPAKPCTAVDCIRVECEPVYVYATVYVPRECPEVTVRETTKETIKEEEGIFDSCFIGSMIK
jgi:hypothetical protein